MSARTAALAALTLGALVSSMAAAKADPVTYTGYSVLNDQTVTLNDPSIGVSNESGGAGQITLTGTNTPGGTFATWCVDIQDYLTGSGNFSSYALAAGPQVNEVSALISNGTQMLAASFDASAALQVAIWEVEYGSNLTVSAPASVLSLANTYVSNVTNGTWTADPSQQLVAYYQSGNQTQVALSPVPEPATLALLGLPLAMVGMTTMRRRRSAATA